MKLYYMLFFSLLFVFIISLNSSSICYGATSSTTKLSIINNFEKLYKQNVINENLYNNAINYVNATNRWSGSTYGDDYFIIISYGGANNQIPFNNGLLNEPMLYLNIVRSGTDIISNYTNNISNTLYNNWNGTVDSEAWYMSNGNAWTNGSSRGFNALVSPYYIYTTIDIDTRLIQLSAGDEYGGLYINNDLRFVPYNNNVQTIDNIDNIHIENFSRSVNDWRLGTIKNFDNYTQGFIDMYLGNENWVQVGSLNWNSNGEVYLNNYRYYYYQLYRIYFYDKDYNYTNTFGYYFLPLGEEYNGQGLIYSGDNNNLNVPIINELQENQNFWEGVYDDLFNMNSGDATEVYNLVSSYFPSGDTPISIYETIFGSFNNDPDDFIIRWDDVPLHITWFNGEVLYSGDFIKANSINISKTCRENEVLRLIKFYINLFVCIGFLITYYFKMYNLIMLIIVGVVPDIVSNTDNDDYKRNEIGFKM